MIRQRQMEDALRQAFAADEIPLRPEVRDEVTSTNSLLKEEAAAGEREGRLLLANAQTAGRGRLSRNFFSPSGSGLYGSILLRPQTGAQTGLLLTVAAAVAVTEAIRLVYGIETGIKWVNDIYYRGRKICGILAEGGFRRDGQGFEFVVVGIGINLRTPPGGFPAEIRDIAGSLLGELPVELSEDEIQRDHRFAAKLWERLWYYYSRLEERSYVPLYQARSILTGRSVRVLGGSREKIAIVEGIDEQCRLLVRFSDGSRQALAYGEVAL